MYILICSHKLDWTPSDYNLVYLNTRALIQISLQEREVIVLDSLEDVLVMSQRSYGKRVPVVATQPSQWPPHPQPRLLPLTRSHPRAPQIQRNPRNQRRRRGAKWLLKRNRPNERRVYQQRDSAVRILIEKYLVHIRWIYSTLQIIT